MVNDARLRLVVLSHVMPFPGSAGQQQRVFYTLKALREQFHLTFLTASDDSSIRAKLAEHCDDVVVLPAVLPRNKVARLPYRAAGAAYAGWTGLRWSNFVIGQLNFAPARIAAAIEGRRFDCALFEYWHAVPAVRVFKERGIPSVVDMHDILWQARKLQLDASGRPEWWKEKAVGRYKEREERAWAEFDALITINRAEHDYVRDRVPGATLFHAPMGTDLDRWRYMWRPVEPVRVAYYGGLATAHNQRAARACIEHVMPAIWRARPDVELWIVGSNPPDDIRALAADARVHVTGYVEDVQPVLAGMTAVLCPWSGTYGFRSRLIEVMGLGVPVVATPDAVYGMDLEEGRGVAIGRSHEDLAALTLELLRDPAFACAQSRLAREQMERRFGLDATYGALARDLREWVTARVSATA